MPACRCIWGGFSGGEGLSCSPVHPTPRRRGTTGPFLPPATRLVWSQLPAHRVGCSTELGLAVWPFQKWRSQLIDRKWFSPRGTPRPAWSRGRPAPLAQTAVSRASELGTRRAAGLGANAGPSGATLLRKLQPRGQWEGCWVALVRKDGPKLRCLEGQEGTDKRVGDEEEWTKCRD